MTSDGEERPSEQRIREAVALGEDVRYFLVACPKDMVMYSDAVKTAGHADRLTVTDIAQLVARAVGLETLQAPIAERTTIERE